MRSAAAVTVDDYRAIARRRLPRLLFDYIDGGAYAETTLARNVADLEKVALRQRVLIDVSQLSLGTELFGQHLSMPLILAPVGLAGLYARRGEVSAARAARAADIPFCLSTSSVCALEEVHAGAGSAFWFQLYMLRDRDFMRRLLERATQSGVPVLVFTIDLAVPGARYRDVRSGFNAPPTLAGRMRRLWDGIAHPRWTYDTYLRGRPHDLGNIVEAMLKADANLKGDFWAWVRQNWDSSVTWNDIAWVRQHWPGPIVLKGILDPQDAREAVRIGVDGLIVSNHGGRQLDGAVSSVRALPAVLDAVGDSIPVLVDGGVRSGLDVLKMLALGARACLIGRPWAFALAAAGERGVANLLTTLRRELEVAMALTGCTDVRGADRELLDRRSVEC